MEKCFFSETQFEAYHSRQLERLVGSSLPQYFPSRSVEGDNGVDMVHFTDFHSLFFQYKVPSSIRSSHPKCSPLRGNCFRMGIYNRNSSGVKGQYELLWDWSETEPFVYYATPKFHTDLEFYRRYSNIIQHTAHFRFRGNFKNPTILGFNAAKHYIYYSDGSNFGKMYSEDPAEVKSDNLENILVDIEKAGGQKGKFGDYLESAKQRISEILFRRDLIGSTEIFKEQLLSDQESAKDNYFVCNYFLQKYFGLTWTLFFNLNNRTPS